MYPVHPFIQNLCFVTYYPSVAGFWQLPFIWLSLLDARMKYKIQNLAENKKILKACLLIPSVV